MTFNDLNQHAYLATLDIAGNGQQQQPSRVLKLEDILIVCRDHFGIRGLYGNSEEVGDCGPGLFFHTISLQDQSRDLLTLSGFFDGPSSQPLIEWSIPTLPEHTFQIFPEGMPSPIGSLYRYTCHDFKDISGISAAVYYNKTVGIFCHKKEHTQRPFKSFINQMQSDFGTSMLLFPYFPINCQEKVQTVGIRWYYRDLVVQAVRPTGGGSVLGLFHRPVDNIVQEILAIGIFASTCCERLYGLNLCPNMDIDYPLVGDWSRDWCFSKAQLDNDATIQLCTAGLACRGAIITYSDNSRESLGEFRVDMAISDKMELRDCFFCNKDDDKLYVFVRSWPDKQEVMDNKSDWKKFPTTGTIVLCHVKGSQVENAFPTPPIRGVSPELPFRINDRSPPVAARIFMPFRRAQSTPPEFTNHSRFRDLTRGSGGDMPEEAGGGGGLEPSWSRRELSRKKSQFYTDAFAYREPSNTAKERVAKDSIILAEVKLNCCLESEQEFLIDFSFQLSEIYQRPVSCIMAMVSTDVAILISSSTEPAYMVTISALASEIAATKNKRSAHLIQDFMQGAVEISPRRGVVRFEAVPEKNLATNGVTALQEIEELERDSGYQDIGILRALSRQKSRRSKKSNREFASETDRGKTPTPVLRAATPSFLPFGGANRTKESKSTDEPSAPGRKRVRRRTSSILALFRS
ncbi:hypothetical protein DV738_g5398, partial [Chaetothyriales sp. CBS 135597]